MPSKSQPKPISAPSPTNSPRLLLRASVNHRSLRPPHRSPALQPLRIHLNSLSATASSTKFANSARFHRSNPHLPYRRQLRPTPPSQISPPNPSTPPPSAASSPSSRSASTASPSSGSTTRP